MASPPIEPVEAVAKKIVKAGFRHLALLNHPDRGGSPNVMIALNQAKAWLDELLGQRYAPFTGQTRAGYENPGDFWSTFARKAQEQDAAAERLRTENLRRQRQREEAKRREQAARDNWIRVVGEWVEIDAVKCANLSHRALCMLIRGRPYWVPRSELSNRSAVQVVGDEGILIISLRVAKKLGLLTGGYSK